MPRQLNPDPFDTTVEPNHQPHLHRLWLGDFPAPQPVAIATQRDGTVRVLPTSPAPLLATVDPGDGAEEGGTWREPPLAREKRERETDWKPGSWRESVAVFGTPIVLLLIVLAVWAYRTWGA